jgi:hypothetical protein
MAKQQKQQQAAPVVPNFRDMDKEATARAAAAIAGGSPALKVPKGAKVSVDKKGTQRSRWQEQATVIEAYRSVTKSGLLDVTVILKIRQSENAGGRVFAHFYKNMSANVPENHVNMNERSDGAIQSLLTVTGFKPAGDEIRGSLLDKMFPPKGQPGTTSPLNSKVVIASIVQTMETVKDQKTGKPVLDDEGEEILEPRDSAESFLPAIATVVADEDDDEDEEEDEDAEEGDDDEDEEEEEEAPAPAPAPTKRKK